MLRSGFRSAVLFATFVLPALPAHAADALAAMAPRPAGSDSLVLAAPPRESLQEGQQYYGAIADYLSGVLQRQVVYRHPGTWGVYRSEMLRGQYDLVFDDPHFNSYRAERLGHEPLVRLPGNFQYAVVLREDRVFTGLQRMNGRTICTFAPPDLGTQFLLSLFDNPLRQPVLLPIQNWEESYQGVLAGRCMGAVMPLALLRQLDPEGRHTKVLLHSAVMPNQTLSAGPRVTRAERVLVTNAMTSPAGAEAAADLLALWRAERGFERVRQEDYVGLSFYLRDEWGFY